MQGEPGKDPLFSNKLAAAGLSAMLLIFGLPQLTRALTGGGHGGGHGDELHLAYGGDLELETGASHGGGEEAPAFDLGAALREASAAAGERRSALCASCHTFNEGGANGTGPNLWDIVGRDVAGDAGFNYTGALAGLGGSWTYERLDAYLKNSQEYVPGTAMVQRIGRDSQRAEIIAYLASLSNNPVPFPEPAAAASADAHGDDSHGDAAADEASDASADENNAEEAADEPASEEEAH